MELVSVVIITYKRPMEILERAIQSVLTQSYQRIELIIVNDAPEETKLVDDIIKRLKELNDERIIYLSYDKNRGSNFARNYGIQNSKGKYIAFLDDDDEWLPNKLKEQVKAIELDDNIALVSCDFSINKGGKIIGNKGVREYKDSDITYLLESNYIGGTSFPLLRREALMEVGQFDEQQKSCQEYELWIRLRQKYQFTSVNQILGIYYLSEDSIYKKSDGRFYDGDKRILEKHKSLYESHKKAFNIHLNQMAYNFFRSKQWRNFCEYKLKAIVLLPFEFANFTVLYKLTKLIKKK